MGREVIGRLIEEIEAWTNLKVDEEGRGAVKAKL